MMEGNLIKEIQLRLSRMGSKLFRNNTGTGWVGDSTPIRGGIILRNHRPLKAGLFVGSSDLIGWTTIEITDQMVGQKLAVFTAIEVKGPGTTLKKHQARFLDGVKRDGGFAFKALSEEESEEALQQHINQLNGSANAKNRG